MLPALLLAFVFSGCDLVDDYIELTEPEKEYPDSAVVRQKIQGEWLNYVSTITNSRTGITNVQPLDRVFTITGDSLVVLGMDDKYERTKYELVERDGKTYVKFLPDPDGNYTYYEGEPEVTSITDTSMVWTWQTMDYDPVEPFDPKNPQFTYEGYVVISTSEFKKSGRKEVPLKSC